MVEIHEGVRRPEPLAQLVARQDLAGTLQQHGEHLEGLLLQLEFRAVLAQLAGTQVHFANAEAIEARIGGGGHDRQFNPIEELSNLRIDEQPCFFS